MEFLGSAVVGLSVGLGISSAVPAALSAVGFTKGGIAAGSLAAKMMSCSAIANGGRVAAGSLVAIAQSLGAAGLPAAVKAVLATIAAALGAALATVFTPVLV